MLNGIEREEESRGVETRTRKKMCVQIRFDGESRAQKEKGKKSVRTRAELIDINFVC